MKLEHGLIAYRSRHPFTISRGSSSAWRRVWVRLIARDGLEGWGEAPAAASCGETQETVLAALAAYAPILSDADGWEIEELERRLERALPGNPAARAAISSALHDLAGKRLGVPVHRLLGLGAAVPAPSSFTIAIPASLDDLARRVADAEAFPVLKVKLGGDRDEAIIRAVRAAAPAKVLRVDANAAWTPKQALAIMPLLAELGVELVEQPVAAHDLDGLRFVRERSPLPIVADESCRVAADVPRLAGAVDGVNIKLAKCGSLREAVRITACARAHGLRVMLGCMIESSLGITAAAHLAPLMDWLDLDGAALLADDPFAGATIDGGVVTLPAGPGLGVTKH